MIKDSPAVQKMQDTWVQPLGREDPLEEKVATHSSILAWSTSWKEKPGGLQSMGLQRVSHTSVTELASTSSFPSTSY